MLFAALAKNAGAIAVALEPRGWDEGGAYDKHKRPDIEWINAATRRFTITDVTIDWTMTVGSGTEHAEGAEKRKVDAYKTAMQRNRESAARARRQPDDFAPLGFAKNGAWGPQAQRIFKRICARGWAERPRSASGIAGSSGTGTRPAHCSASTRSTYAAPHVGPPAGSRSPGSSRATLAPGWREETAAAGSC